MPPVAAASLPASTVHPAEAPAPIEDCLRQPDPALLAQCGATTSMAQSTSQQLAYWQAFFDARVSSGDVSGQL